MSVLGRPMWAISHVNLQQRVTALQFTVQNFAPYVLISSSHKTICRDMTCTVLKVVVASFTEIKTDYRGFETKQNLVFRMLVLCIENYSQAYMSDNL